MCTPTVAYRSEIKMSVTAVIRSVHIHTCRSYRTDVCGEILHQILQFDSSNGVGFMEQIVLSHRGCDQEKLGKLCQK